MKIRTGFVSNSSSSSFVIARSALTDEQVGLIRYHVHAAAHGLIPGPADPYRDAWEITVTETMVHGETYMDNFDMYDFLRRIGVKAEDISIETDG